MIHTELLILDYVIEVWVSIQWLSDKNAIEEILNKPFHNTSIPDLKSLLENLFREDYIIARRESDEGYIYFTPTLREIEEGLSFPSLQGSLFDYGLMPKGGAFWEHFTDPQWDKYIHQSYGIYTSEGVNPHLQEGEIITTSKYFTQQHLEEVKKRQLPITGILSETETWDVLCPWQATYWKELSSGHRVTFLYTDEPSLGEESIKSLQVYSPEYIPWYKIFW